jgi:hypothetical protein
VQVEQMLHFAFCLTSKFISRSTNFLISKLYVLLVLRKGDCGNYCGWLQVSLLPRNVGTHTREIGVSLGERGRRVPGPIILLSVLDGKTFDGR